MNTLFDDKEREIAELIFDKFRKSRCKPNEIVPMRTIRFGLLPTLNPKEVELFPIVCNGLIHLRYIDYLPDGLESLRLTQKGYDYIYDESLTRKMRNIPWIIPSIENTDWNIAFDRMWKQIGNHDSKYFIKPTTFFNYVNMLAVQNGETINEIQYDIDSREYCKSLVNQLSERTRYSLYVNIQNALENIIFGEEKTR